MKIFFIILGFLPSFLHVFIRNCFGAKIDSTAKIRVGSMILCNDVILGAGAIVGPFVVIRCRKLMLGRFSMIKSFCYFSCPTINIGEGSIISIINFVNCDWRDTSQLAIGDHSSIFPFCWLEPGEGIFIGNQVGIGGHTLIFTHGVWPNYLHGGPISRGPVHFENGVWLPWRVFVLPGVTIGTNAIVGAGAVVNKSIPANSLAVGIPARIIKEGLESTIQQEDQKMRIVELMQDFADTMKYKFINDLNGTIQVQSLKGSIVFGATDLLNEGDVLLTLDLDGMDQRAKALIEQRRIAVIDFAKDTIYQVRTNPLSEKMITFLRRYGIRLYQRSPLGDHRAANSTL